MLLLFTSINIWCFAVYMALHVCILTYLKSVPLFWTTLYRLCHILVCGLPVSSGYGVELDGVTASQPRPIGCCHQPWFPLLVTNAEFRQTKQTNNLRLLHLWQNAMTGMPERRIKANRPILPVLPLKLVAMTTPLDRSEKGRSVNNLYDPIPAVRWRFDKK